MRNYDATHDVIARKSYLQIMRRDDPHSSNKILLFSVFSYRRVSSRKSEQGRVGMSLNWTQEHKTSASSPNKRQSFKHEYITWNTDWLGFGDKLALNEVVHLQTFKAVKQWYNRRRNLHNNHQQILKEKIYSQMSRFVLLYMNEDEKNIVAIVFSL